jgi:DNA-binding beta-propeller fold protein YncE
VSDLRDELRKLAEDGARQARPLAVADVIRRGDRRHWRTMALRAQERARPRGLATPARPGRRWPGWVAPLAAAAVVTAVVASAAVLSGAIRGSGSGHRPAAPTIYASYQALNGSHGVIVPISTATNTLGRPIRADNFGGEMQITPDGKKIYVSGNDEVVPISTASNRPGQPVQVPGVASNFVMLMSPDGKTVYIITFMDYDTIIPVSMAAHTVGRPISVSLDDSPPVIAFTPDGKTAYVGSQGHTITPISTVTNRPGQPIHIGFNAANIAITPDGKTAYVTGFSTDQVVPISTATNTPGQPIRIGARPREMAITPGGKAVYVITYDGTIVPISTATNTPDQPVRTGLTAGPLTISPDGKKAYIESLDGTIIPFSTVTNTAGQPIRISRPGPIMSIVFTPDGKTAYVAVMNRVIPISTATNTPGQPIRVPYGFPSGIVITP